MTIADQLIHAATTRPASVSGSLPAAGTRRDHARVHREWLAQWLAQWQPERLAHWQPQWLAQWQPQWLAQWQPECEPEREPLARARKQLDRGVVGWHHHRPHSAHSRERIRDRARKRI